MVIAMPISLRLPVEVEKQIAGYSARHGVSKSAVIVRSISEFLANHAQPSSFQIYEEAMREAQVESSAGNLIRSERLRSGVRTRSRCVRQFAASTRCDQGARLKRFHPNAAPRQPGS